MQLKFWLLAGHEIVKPEWGAGVGGDSVGLPNIVFTGIIVVVKVDVEVVLVLMQLWFGYGTNLPSWPENQPQGSWSLSTGQKGIVVVDEVEVDVDVVDEVVLVDVDVLVVDIIFAVASTLTELATTTAIIRSNTTADNSAGSFIVPIHSHHYINFFSFLQISFS